MVGSSEGRVALRVITSPPWDRNRRFSADDVFSRHRNGLTGVFEMAGQIAPRVVLHLSKTIDVSQSVEESRGEGLGACGRRHRNRRVKGLCERCTVPAEI
uniref:Uncharacterized protein n=1 Tax=Sipha flava TaxID=143950 RepID=A0A2S2RBS4_9HEMI